MGVFVAPFSDTVLRAPTRKGTGTSRERVHHGGHDCNWNVQTHSESEKYPRSFPDGNQPCFLRRDRSELM